MATIIKAESVEQLEALTPAQRAPDDAGADGDEPAARPARRLIRGLDSLAAEAQKVMLDARQQAARVLGEARTQADAAREEAVAKGYAEGLAQGLAEGHEQGLRRGREEAKAQFGEQSAELVEQLRRIVGELEAAHADTIHCGRCELLDFALAIAGKIVGRVAVRDLDAARENLHKVLELADRRREMSVRVNPRQLEALTAMLPDLTGSLGRSGQVRLVGDESISPGGAKLQTAGGEIDATIETQLANIAEALVGSQASSDGAYVSVETKAPERTENQAS